MGEYRTGDEHDGWSRALVAVTGFALGAAAALLAVRKVVEDERLGETGAAQEGASLVSRVIASIPMRIKVATGLGAAKGGIQETARVAKSRIKHAARAVRR